MSELTDAIFDLENNPSTYLEESLNDVVVAARQVANINQGHVGDVLQAMFGTKALIVPAAAVDNVIDAVLGTDQ